MTVLSNRYSRDRFSVETTNLPTTFIERIELTNNTLEVDQVIDGVSSHQSLSVKDDTDAFLNYDAEKDRLVANKPLETTVASLHLKDAHTMSSGAEYLVYR